MATTVTVKGQVTLPKAVREAAGIKPGDRVDVRATPRGVFIEKPSAAEAYSKRLETLDRTGFIGGASTDEIMRELRGDPEDDYR